MRKAESSELNSDPRHQSQPSISTPHSVSSLQQPLSPAFVLSAPQISSLSQGQGLPSYMTTFLSLARRC